MRKERTDKQYIYCKYRGEDVPIIQRFVEIFGEMQPITEPICDMQNFCDKRDCPYNNRIL